MSGHHYICHSGWLAGENKGGEAEANVGVQHHLDQPAEGV